MPEIAYKKFSDQIKSFQVGGEDFQATPVYLFYGEEYLTKALFEELLNAFLPPEQRSLNYLSFDGSEEETDTALQHVNTFSMMPGRKIVAIQDAMFFQARQDVDKILGRIKKNVEREEIRKAANGFINLLRLLDISLDELDEDDLVNQLGLASIDKEDSRWLLEIVSYCRSNRLSKSPGSSTESILQEAIKKGFPKDNFLFITADRVDKRKSLYRTILENGTVINCSMPLGDRKADQTVQNTVTSERLSIILANAGKRIDPEAYQGMLGLTGFDLRTFMHNAEKLIDYVGDRETITLADVQSVMTRSKKDPIYAFTNAIVDRHCDDALYYLDSLLSEAQMGHPLQLLSAIINQIRKLLVARAFLESDYGKHWISNCSYSMFTKTILPLVQAYDQQTLEHSGQLAFKNGKKGRKKRSLSDLIIARNPKSPYPVYQLLIKAESYSTQQLIAALKTLAQADIQLKTSSQDSVMILKQVVLTLCQL